MDWLALLQMLKKSKRNRQSLPSITDKLVTKQALFQFMIQNSGIRLTSCQFLPKY